MIRKLGILIAVLAVGLAPYAVTAAEDHDTVAVGCSNTDRAVNTYTGSLAGTHFDTRVRLGGGSVVRWATDSRDHWSRSFEPQVHEGITQVWWNLCSQSNDPNLTDAAISNLTIVYEELRARLGDEVTVYVSALNGYEPGMPRYPAYLKTVAMAEWLFEESGFDVEPGPVMPVLDPSLVGSDDIHPNGDGKLLMAEALWSFFDGTEPPSTTIRTRFSR